MGRRFNIPIFYRSSIISTLKNFRNGEGVKKKDLSPSILDLGAVRFKVARHFGFCFGVENAIEIAYRAIDENPEKRVFLLSEMIHNANVNDDLLSRGVRFLQRTDGTPLIPFAELRPEDIVIVPAFGTTREVFAQLEQRGVNPTAYNATCPFVEKVWKRAAQLGEKGYTIVIHGKYYHEETRATFSHAVKSGPSLVVRDMEQTEELCRFIIGERPLAEFDPEFFGLASAGFDPRQHFERIGVVNQTTMLSGETQAISERIKTAMIARDTSSGLGDRFADTRDTLCYATTENQHAMKSLIQSGGDIAIVVGGYNSSNTSHLVELCESLVPAYYIKDASEILSAAEIRHLDLNTKEVKITKDWLPKTHEPLEILLSAGASCPDALVDEVISRIALFFQAEERIESALVPFISQANA